MLLCIIEDETKVTQAIHQPDVDMDNLIRPAVASPELTTVYSGEEITPEDVDVDNVIIADIEAGKEGKDGKDTVRKLTCLSDNWQASNVETEHWEFDCGDNEVDRAEVALIKGSSAELAMDTDRPGQLDDLVPKSDIGYARRLAGLFKERNRQLMDTMH